MITSVSRCEPRLFVSADGADYGRVEMLRPLTQDQTDTARRSLNQDGFAWLDRINQENKRVRGHPFEQPRGGRLRSKLGARLGNGRVLCTFRSRPHGTAGILHLPVKRRQENVT
jgi:hypothetical protein